MEFCHSVYVIHLLTHLIKLITCEVDFLMNVMFFLCQTNIRAFTGILTGNHDVFVLRNRLTSETNASCPWSKRTWKERGTGSYTWSKNNWSWFNAHMYVRLMKRFVDVKVSWSALNAMGSLYVEIQGPLDETRNVIVLLDQLGYHLTWHNFHSWDHKTKQWWLKLT